MAKKKQFTITKPTVLRAVNDTMQLLGLPKVKSLTVTATFVCPPGYEPDVKVGDNGLEEYCRKIED